MLKDRLALKGFVYCMTAAFIMAMILPFASVGQIRQGAQQRRSNAASNVDTSSPAPTGTYTATTGMTAGTASGAGMRGRARGAASGGENVSATITMNIDRYVTSQDIESFLEAQQSGAQQLLQAFSTKKYGTVTVGEQSFDINMAASAKVGAGYKIYLVSAQPFASGTGSQGRSGKGAAGGFIELTLNGSGGTGMFYTSTQVVIQSNGTVQARAGASTATSLTGVAHK